MQARPYEIGTIYWQQTGRYPTHVTIKLYDLDLLPALREFAEIEKVNIIPAETKDDIEREHEYWLGYLGSEIEAAKQRLERHMGNAYR